MPHTAVIFINDCIIDTCLAFYAVLLNKKNNQFEK